MKAFPFQSNYTGDDGHGNPTYDRAVDAEFFRSMWRLFFTDGVFANPSTNFQVLANSGMNIKVKPGTCFIKGVTGIEILDTDIVVPKASDISARTDIIVLRVDFTQNRSLSIELKENTTTLRRDSDVWEMQLASIHVKQNAMAINQSDITDTRLDSNVCGVVTSVINQVDTTTIFNQYMDYWNRKKTENESKWQEQMNLQEQRFVEQRNSIEAWYASVKANISLLKTFDFDNIAELNGSKRDTTFNVDGSIYELISISANGRKIAERHTSFLGDGRISVNVKVYKDDGATVIKESTTVTTFNGNGTITEVVS